MRWIAIAWSCATLAALAYSGGITGVTSSGCTCHGAQSSATTLSLSGNTTTRAGQTLNLTVVVAHSSQQAAGVNIAVKDQQGQNVGTLAPATGSGLQLSNGELTHQQPKTMSNGQAAFSFTWTAPSTPGTYTLRAAGCAVNGNGNNSGDAWNFLSPVTLTVAGIRVEQPNGGEVWCAGSTQTIRWSSVGVQNVKIEVSSNGGQSWSVLVASVSAQQGSYQWSIPSTQTPGTQYRIRISDAADSTLFDVSDANFSIAGPPQLTAQPQPATVCEGQSVVLSVGAQGTALTYQWRRNGQNIPGATQATYQFVATLSDAGIYDVVVSNACGSVTSDTVRVTVKERPRITQQPPASLTVCVGQSVTLRVTATGTGLRYQWRRNGTPIPGATQSSYTIAAVQPADSGIYDVVVSGECEPPAYSTQTELRVTGPPQIVEHPQSQSVRVGQSVTFRVQAQGQNLQYQWRKNGVAIAGATQPQYTIAAAQLADAGLYDCLVWNECGQSVSQAARLTVVQPGQPVLALRQAQVEFGVRELGDSAAQTLAGIVYNAGDDTLRISAIALVGEHSGDYRLVMGGGSVVLPPGAEHTLVLAFVPSAVGERRAELNFSANVSSPPVLKLRGYGAVPQLSASVQQLEFDSVELQRSRELPLELVNSGVLELQLEELRLEGDTAFSLVTPPMLPLRLDSAARQPLTVRFAPMRKGEHQGMLMAVYAGRFHRDTLRVALRGIGKEPVGIAVPSETLLPELAFTVTASQVVVRYRLPDGVQAQRALIVSLDGRRLAEFPCPAGPVGELRWQVNGAASGVYWLGLQVGTRWHWRAFLLQR
jgi:hypothetical protein